MDRVPWGKVNSYCKHAVAVAIGFALALGVADPITGTVHVTGPHVLFTIGAATVFQLLADYSGLTIPRSRGRSQ